MPELHSLGTICCSAAVQTTQLTADQQMLLAGFRVMRLCRPSLLADAPLQFNLQEDFACGWPSSSEPAQPVPPEDVPWARRIELQRPVGYWGSEGLLELPQSFGMIYLGEVRGSAAEHVRMLLLCAC